MPGMPHDMLLPNVIYAFFNCPAFGFVVQLKLLTGQFFIIIRSRIKMRMQEIFRFKIPKSIGFPEL